MKVCRFKLLFTAAVFTGAVAPLWLSGGAALANHDAKDRSDPAEFGEIGPLLMTHKDAIHSVLVWTGDGVAEPKTPKVCFWMRNSQYPGTALVDPAGVSPDGGATGGYKNDFGILVRAGDPSDPVEDNFSDRLDRSTQTPATDDIALNNGLCWDLTDGLAFANDGEHEIAIYNDGGDGIIDIDGNGDPTGNDLGWEANLNAADDYYLNSAAFTPASHSAGLNYDVFCSGNVQLADGRILFIGGHDIDGSNGLRKLQIFDPEDQTWVPIAAPSVKSDYLDHPTATIVSGDPHLDHFNDGHAHDDASIDTNADPIGAPGVQPDMLYQRWYPSGVLLPNGMVLILSGTDRTDGDRNTTVQTTTPEVYDPVAQTVVALENARKALPNEYPLAYVVQRGPGVNDWVVAVVGEHEDPPASIMAAQIPGGRGIDENGNTYYLDVLAALGDSPSTPDENHWEGPIAVAQHPHGSAGAAQIWELKGNGTAKSMKVVAFGGEDETVEMIDYADANPQWVEQDPLYKSASNNDAAVGPDGKVLIVGGARGRNTPDLSLHYQMFNPKNGKMKLLDGTTIPRADHTTLLLLPDASFLVMGSDRTLAVSRNLLQDANGDPVNGDPDLGVPTAQIYKPPYLFWGERPVIEEAPEVIGYGSSFEVDVSGKGKTGKIESVVLIRPSPKTHKWDWGNRYVKLAFDQKKDVLTIKEPAVPGLALPGNYMLFVLNKDGVPSVAELVHLQ